MRVDCSTVAKRLHDLRVDNDYTQSDIATYLCTTQHQISKYERGVQEIPVRVLLALSQFYNVSLDYIAGYTDIICPPNRSK